MARLAVAAASLLGLSAAQAQVAVVTGVVHEAKGAPIFGAEVLVDGTELQARTDSLGRFRIQGAPLAAVRISARRLGYKVEALYVTLGSERDNVVDIRLDPLPQSIDEVVITGRNAPRDSRMEGFYSRAANHNGGHFITRSQIDKQVSGSALNLIRTAPGVRIGYNGRFGRTVRLRGNTCAPVVFMDGFPLTAGPFDFESVDAASIEGIEIYGGLASIPSALSSPRGLDQCGVIAIWSRNSVPETRRRRIPKLTEAQIAASNVRALVAASIAYATDAVDVRAALDQTSFAPVYPEELTSERVTGQVRVEFVVDSVGSILWETYSVIASSDRRFNTAVRDALLKTRFKAAERSGRHVAQVMQVPVVFLPPGPSGADSSPAGAAIRRDRDTPD